MHDSTTTVAELRDVMSRFVAARKWEKYHDPKNLSASIAIEAAELMEHFQWIRSDEIDRVRNDEAQMADIADEVADILAYLLSFANAMNIDLSDALSVKMIKNDRKYPPEKYMGTFRPEADDKR